MITRHNKSILCRESHVFGTDELINQEFLIAAIVYGLVMKPLADEDEGAEEETEEVDAADEAEDEEEEADAEDEEQDTERLAAVADQLIWRFTPIGENMQGLASGCYPIGTLKVANLSDDTVTVIVRGQRTDDEQSFTVLAQSEAAITTRCLRKVLASTTGVASRVNFSFSIYQPGIVIR